LSCIEKVSLTKKTSNSEKITKHFEKDFFYFNLTKNEKKYLLHNIIIKNRLMSWKSMLHNLNKWKYFSLNEKISKIFLINIFKLFKRAYQIKKYCKKNNINSTISFMEEANFSNILSKILFKNSINIYISIHSNLNRKSTAYKNIVKKLYNFSR